MIASCRSFDLGHDRRTYYGRIRKTPHIKYLFSRRYPESYRDRQVAKRSRPVYQFLGLDADSITRTRHACPGNCIQETSGAACDLLEASIRCGWCDKGDQVQ